MNFIVYLLFIFDIRPTIQWKIIEHFLKLMPNLRRLIIRNMNTRCQWSLSKLGQILKENVPDLNYLKIKIISIGTKKILQNETNCHMFHPVFGKIQSKIENSPKVSSTAILTSILY